MFTKMKAFDLTDPVIDTGELTVTFSFSAEVCDMADEVIVEAVVAAAKDAGITQLYLLDRDFIHDAIREKLERDGGASECL